MWQRFCESTGAFRKNRGPITAQCRAVRFQLHCFFLFALGLAAQTVALPEGKGKAVFQKMCSQCHGLDVAVASRQTQVHWRSTVEDMVARGARGTDAEIDTVVSYLAANFGELGAEAPTAGCCTCRSGYHGERAAWKPVPVPEAEQWPAFGHDLGRVALLSPEADYARQCRETAARVDIPHRKAKLGMYAAGD